MSEQFTQPESFKTRVLIYSRSFAVAQLAKKILDFHQKNVDWLGHENNDSDFAILHTADFQQAKDFKSTIAYMGTDASSDDVAQIAANITPGGVLIYPENVEQAVHNSDNYSRKLGFSKADLNGSVGSLTLTTEIGELPLSVSDEAVLENLNGIKLFCTQLGIMDEDFYEALVEI